jgi:ferric-dicitrate binding protein FerR (iron transport regulator)
MLKKILLAATLMVFSLSVNSAALSANLKTTAKIASFKNSVQLKYHSSLWRNATLNQQVKPGTSIRTGEGSKAQIIYQDGTITNIGSRTSLTVLDKKTREVKIISGNFWYKVTKKSFGLKIYLPNAIATITGTEGGVKVETNKTVTLVVAEGTISVNMNNKKYSMKAGDKVSYSTLHPTAVDYKNIGAENVKNLFESSQLNSGSN